MKNKTLRRAVAGASVLTIAAGLTAAIGLSSATAATLSTDWSQGNSVFNRTISDDNPAVGDTVTISTRFKRKIATGLETIQQVRDSHPACLTYVDDSATVDGNAQSIESFGNDYHRVTGSWIVNPTINPNQHIFAFSYKVGENCALNTTLTTGMDYYGSLGAGNYPAQGPNLKVKQAISTTAVTISPAPQSNTGSLLTATVSPAAATGQVEFFNGTTSLGTAPLTGGIAKINWTPALNQGGQNFSITAKYLGDTNRVYSTSAATSGTIAVGQVAPPAPSGLASSANPATVGTPVTISGRAEAGSSVTVTAGTETCTATADSRGTFACDLTPTKAGDITIRAAAANAAGTSAPSSPGMSLTVKPALVVPAAPALTVSAPTVTIGKPVTVTVTTEAGNTVVITADGTQLHSGAANPQGIVTATYSPAAVGASEVTATAGNAAGTSPAATKTVSVTAVPTAPAAPSGLSLNPAAIVVGQSTTVSGKAEAGSTVTVTGAGKTCSTTASPQGDFSCVIAPTIVGASSVSANATNSVGTSPSSTAATLTVNSDVVIPPPPAVALSAASVTVGDEVTATITTVPGATVKVTVDGQTSPVPVDGAGQATYKFTPTTPGTTTVSVTAGNSAGTSPATTASVTAKQLPQGQAALAVNPSAPVAGEPVVLTVSNADPGSTVTIKNGATEICSATVADDRTARCTWHPAAGPYTLTVDATVDGRPQALPAKPVTVATAPTTDPGTDPGDGGNTGGAGSLGSLGTLFGSLGG